MRTEVARRSRRAAPPRGPGAWSCSRSPRRPRTPVLPPSLQLSWFPSPCCPFLFLSYVSCLMCPGYLSQAQRHPELEPRARSRFALDPEPPACKLGALPDGDDPDVSRHADRLPHDKARAVVPDLDAQAAVGFLRDDRHHRRVRVLLDVAERLGDVLQRDALDRRRDPAGEAAVDVS